MIHYDFDYFLSSVRHLDYKDIKSIATEQLGKLSSKVKKEEVVSYGRNMQGLLIWMETGKRPRGLSDVEFGKMKAIAENLVAKKQLKKSVMTAF
jgi:hypothetical protein